MTSLVRETGQNCLLISSIDCV